jgi:hypothetical protein
LERERDSFTGRTYNGGFALHFEALFTVQVCSIKKLIYTGHSSTADRSVIRQGWEFFSDSRSNWAQSVQASICEEWRHRERKRKGFSALSKHMLETKVIYKVIGTRRDIPSGWERM